MQVRHRVEHTREARFIPVAVQPWDFPLPLALPRIDGRQRGTVRISLGTRCPHAAGDLARYLASHGRLIRGDERLAKLRHDEMRRMVRD